MGRRAIAVAAAAFAVGIAVTAGIFFAVDFFGAAEDPENSRNAVEFLGIAENAQPVGVENWEVRRVRGDVLVTATGLDLVLAISCRGDLPAMVLLLHRGSFGSRDVSVQWDGGTPEDYTLRTVNETLALLPATDILRGFRRYDTLLIAAERSSGQPVRDRFSLRGAADAVDSLPCGILVR